MNLSAPFILRPVMTSLVMIALFFLGVLCYSKLPVSDLPAVEYPTIEVNASLPGANPETMANTMATPLERAFMTVNGLRTVTSSSSQGSTTIILQFNLDVDINVAAQDVNAAISQTLPILPPNLPNNPTYQKVNPSSSPIYYLCLSSATMTQSELFTYADSYIGKRLAMVEGVAQVLTYGSPYAARINVDPEILAGTGLDLSTVANALTSGNVDMPLGDLDGVERYFLIRNRDGQLFNAEEYNSLIIKYTNGAPLRVEDVGQARDALADEYINLRYLNQHVDENTVLLGIQKRPNANTIHTVQGVEALLPTLKKDLPGSLRLGTIFNRAETIVESIDDLEFTLILAFCLVVIVIFCYLGSLKDTIIPIAVIPMAFFGSFILMYLAHFSLDNLSLMALLLAIGFIIDDAIVVLENVVRHTEEGKPPFDAAMCGSQQISGTVLTMTLALSCVFIPLLFLSGMLGRLFSEFAITMVMAILLSGVLSLTLTPMMCSRFLPERGVTPTHSLSQRLNESLVAIYQKVLKFVLRFRVYTLLAGIGALVATLFLFSLLPTTLTAEDDLGLLIGTTQTAQSSSTRETAVLQEAIVEIIRKNPAIEDFVTLVGWSGNNSGLFFARLKPKGERPSIQKVQNELYGQMWNVAGISTYIRTIPFIDLSVGSSSNADYQYVLSGLDAPALYQAANQMIQELQTLDGFFNVNSDMQVNTPQIELTLQRDVASSYGLTAQAIQSILGYAYSGGKVSLIQTPSNEYNVIVETTRQFRNQPTNLNSLYLQTPSGQGNLVPLLNFTSLQESLGASVVNHFNQLPSVTISFSLHSHIALSEALATVDTVARKILPPSVTSQLQGTAKQFDETMHDFTFLIFVAVVTIYLILGILYESYLLPIAVLAALPIAVLGGLSALLLFNEQLSLYALLGLVLLIGIVQKNGIMLVDFANELIKEGKDPETAIIQAGSIRFRPILMTTLAAVMGAVPIAIGFGAGGEARQPLGIVLIGGLLVAQLFTLFLIPVVFLFLQKLRVRTKTA